ncbi:hypothetical protein ZYGR_0AG02740 [Zygosaccharomyces rouxii]|uniref:Uncharacterized protein n=1 Tax=Zygosaccharomyces rouxii TaxID=4956 RepID=A0A1Q3A9N1_ZYGRO|nr:hypothetical protein ZYGR_0AG02740 [Zygosaccharomyces rouxii]
MNVAATAIKSELIQVVQGGESEARARIRRYLQYAGFTPGCVKELPTTSTSELCLDTEMLFYLISLNKFETLEENTNLDASTTPSNEEPRRLRLFSSIYLKFKRGFLHHYHGHAKFNKRSSGPEEEGDAVGVGTEFDEKMEVIGFENGGDSYKGGSPSSVQTVIQNDNLVMITTPGLPIDPKPTTNILKIM